MADKSDELTEERCIDWLRTLQEQGPGRYGNTATKALSLIGELYRLRAAVSSLTSEVSVEEVIELARKKYPSPDTYFSVEFSDCQMWKSVKLTVTDCGKVDGPALYCGAFCTIEELAAQLRDPAGA